MDEEIEKLNKEIARQARLITSNFTDLRDMAYRNEAHFKENERLRKLVEKYEEIYGELEELDSNI